MNPTNTDYTIMQLLRKNMKTRNAALWLGEATGKAGQTPAQMMKNGQSMEVLKNLQQQLLGKRI